ncbi:hypothetical protein [Nocardia carnea]|uniref:Uncharacterized protein n=1 Tax=Nocardia carnea TaxID=37328 RepID=A0ABW7THU8_9NOCA|nr:hypothetical protein [Nocardia carnea]
MTDVLPPVGTTQSDAVATLAGVLLGHDEGAVRIQVADGTWTFDPCDVLGIREHDGRSSSPAGAVLVDIRSGATADFTRRLRIDVGERPLTLAAPPSPALGDTQLRRLTETWARRLHLAELPHHPATFTFAQTRSHNSSDDGVHCDSLD